MSKKEILIEQFLSQVCYELENNLLNEGINVDKAVQSIKKFVQANINKNPVMFLNTLKNRFERLGLDKLVKQKLFYVAIMTLISLKATNSSVYDMKFDNPVYDEVIAAAKSKENKTKNLKSFNNFKKDLAFRESSGDWMAINSLGYMGLYQLGTQAIKDVIRTTKDLELKAALKKVTPAKFKRNPNIFPKDIQERAFEQLLKNNQHYLRNYFDRTGDTIKDIELTKSGLLAAAHIGGNSGVKKFIASNGEYDPSDIYGTKISDYLKKFADYKIEL